MEIIPDGDVIRLYFAELYNVRGDKK